MPIVTTELLARLLIGQFGVACTFLRGGWSDRAGRNRSLFNSEEKMLKKDEGMLGRKKQCMNTAGSGTII